jgi:hypothetical protein
MPTTISKKVVAIVKTNGVYEIRYEVTELVENTYALAAYTGNLKANGTVAKSRTVKKLYNDVKQRTSDVYEVVSGAVAQAIYKSGTFGKPQHTDAGWVVWAS